MSQDRNGSDAPQASCLHVLLVQDMPGLWSARGLEHDLVSEARTIGEALRNIVSLVDAHSAFDRRHRRAPLSAFGAAPQFCWNSFTSGTPIAPSQLGVDHPEGWQIVAAIAHRRPAPIRVLREKDQPEQRASA